MNDAFVQALTNGRLSTFSFDEVAHPTQILLKYGQPIHLDHICGSLLKIIMANKSMHYPTNSSTRPFQSSWFLVDLYQLFVMLLLILEDMANLRAVELLYAGHKEAVRLVENDLHRLQI